MKTIKASEFKARCLQLMDEVAETGEEIVITKHGRPVSRLVPHAVRPASLFGTLAEVVELGDDVITPVEVEWEANR